MIHRNVLAELNHIRNLIIYCLRQTSWSSKYFLCIATTDLSLWCRGPRSLAPDFGSNLIASLVWSLWWSIEMCWLNWTYSQCHFLISFCQPCGPLDFLAPLAPMPRRELERSRSTRFLLRAPLWSGAWNKVLWSAPETFFCGIWSGAGMWSAPERTFLSSSESFDWLIVGHWLQEWGYATLFVLFTITILKIKK